MERKAYFLDRSVELKFDYDPATNDRLRSLFGARFKPDNRRWRIPCTQERRPWVAKELKRMGFSGCEQYLPKETPRVYNLEPFELGPDQVSCCKRMVDERSLLVAMDIGQGKTRTALAAVEIQQSYPLLVICQKSAVLTWLGECATVLPHRKAGFVSAADWEAGHHLDLEILVVNYENVSRGVKLDEHADPPVYIIPAMQHLEGIRSLVIDESHNMATGTTQIAIAILALSRQAENVYALSGTPMKGNPKDLIPQLEAIGRLHEVAGTRTNFIRQFCPYKRQRFGGKFIPQNLDKLHEALAPVMFRSVNPNKKTRRIVVPVEIPANDHYWAAERDLRGWLAKFAPDGLKGAVTSEGSTKLSYLRQLAVSAKLKPGAEWIKQFHKDHPDEGLVIFFHHRATHECLAKLIGRPSKAIHGGVSMSERQEAIDEFQAGTLKDLFVQLRAGGSSINLFNGWNGLAIETDWMAYAQLQAEGRMDRRGQLSDKVMMYYLVARGTVDEKLIRNLNRTMEQSSIVVDDQRQKLLQELRGRAA